MCSSTINILKYSERNLDMVNYSRHESWIIPFVEWGEYILYTEHCSSVEEQEVYIKWYNENFKGKYQVTLGDSDGYDIYLPDIIIESDDDLFLFKLRFS